MTQADQLIILEKNIRVVIGISDNAELFIRDLKRGQEVELCRYDTEKLFKLLSDTLFEISRREVKQ